MKNTKLSTERNVIDASEDIILEITPKDVNNASTKHPGACAAAKACKRQLGHEARIHISRIYVKENGSDIWLRYITTKALRTEIIAFDRGGNFYPGKFLLKAPTKSSKLGSDRNRNAKSSPSGRKKQRYHNVKDIRTGPASGM
jgi:hypothetical protein